MKRISDKIEKILNAQIKKEYESSFLYQSFAQCLDFNGWFGAAKLYKKYSDEEQTHAKMIMEYMQDRDCEPLVPVVETKKHEYKGIKEIVDSTYNHEIMISDSIKQIALDSLAEKDLSTYEFISQLVKEQISEEKKALYWVDRIQMFESTSTPLYFLDAEMEKSELA